jgi:hypothetical protein
MRNKIDIKIKLNQFLRIKLKKIRIKNYLKKIQQPKDLKLNLK